MTYSLRHLGNGLLVAAVLFSTPLVGHAEGWSPYQWLFSEKGTAAKKVVHGQKKRPTDKDCDRPYTMSVDMYHDVWGMMGGLGAPTVGQTVVSFCDHVVEEDQAGKAAGATGGETATGGDGYLVGAGR